MVTCIAHVKRTRKQQILMKKSNCKVKTRPQKLPYMKPKMETGNMPLKTGDPRFDVIHCMRNIINQSCPHSYVSILGHTFVYLYTRWCVSRNTLSSDLHKDIITAS